MRSWMRKTMMLACLAAPTMAPAALHADEPMPIAMPTSMGFTPQMAMSPNGMPAAGYASGPSFAPQSLPQGAMPYGVMPQGAMPPGAAGYGAAPAGAPASISGVPVANAPASNQIVYADNGAPSAWTSGYTLVPEGQRFSVRGWLDGGYVYNADHPNSNFNGPYNSVYRADEAMFNQAYLIAEYGLPKDNCFGWGARVDALYGMDYLVAQSVGFETNTNGSPRWNSNQFYGVAIPQAYAILGTENTNVKVGHFYSIVGYEGVPSANNFFYSKAYSYQFAGPFTHWGVLGSTNLTDQLQIQAGAHMGWNTLDSTSDHVSGIAGIKYTGCNKNWWTSFAVTSGQEFNNVAGLPGINPGYANRTRYSFIVDLMPTDRLEYVFHQWLGWQDSGTPDGGVALWYGIDQYAYYKINDCLKFGSRFEWFRDEDGTRVGLTLPNNPNKAPLPGSYYIGTVGFNYSPISNLMIRPEARWDFATDTGVRKPYNDGTSGQQFMLAVDAILKF